MRFEKHSHLAISLLYVICDRDKQERVEAILEKSETFFNLVTYGKGTANSRILDYFGLGETEKAIFFIALTADTGQKIAEILDAKLQLSKPGHGILFTTNVLQGCYYKPVEFINHADGGITMQQDSPHNLIIVVLNRGYGEDVMDVARASGATGGTVLHARSCGTAGMEKFFGVTIAPEKEILMILVQDTNTRGIMSDIAEKAGPSTDAGAISFSLPVSGVKGIETRKMR